MRVQLGMYYAGLTQDEYPFVIEAREVWALKNNEVVVKGSMSYLYTRRGYRVEEYPNGTADIYDLIRVYRTKEAAMKGAVYLERWYDIYRGTAQDDNTIWGRRDN